MSRALSGTAQYLKRAAALVTAYPFTVSAWAYLPSTPGVMTVWSEADEASANNYWWVYLSGGKLTCSVAASGGENFAQTLNTMSANVWAHCCFLASASNSRTAYLNADVANKGTSTTNKTPVGLDNTGVGMIQTTGAAGDLLTGNLAEFGLWNVALTEPEITVLALGVSPLFVRPASLVAYHPLLGQYSPEIDLRGGADLTVTGATAGNHCRVLYPRRQLVLGTPDAAPPSVVPYRTLMGVGA